jgi:hypothetical protein
MYKINNSQIIQKIVTKMHIKNKHKINCNSQYKD